MAASSLPPRPRAAVGTFLRIITVNDVYKLDNYAKVATAVKRARAEALEHDCKVIATLNGDFLSPSVFTTLDGGVVMSEALNQVGFDYVCLGNHEFDLKLDKLCAVLHRLKAVVLNSNVPEPLLAEFPRYASVSVGERSVLLVGALTNDPAIYPVHRRFRVDAVTEGILSAWEAAKIDLGQTPDVLLPLTHQLVEDDLSTAASFNKHPELKTRVPCVLGGHEHEIFVRQEGSSMIIKTGCDCESVGVVDVWWSSSASSGTSVPKCSLALLPAEIFPEDYVVQKWAQQKQSELQKKMKVPLLTLVEPISSKGVRFGEVTAATYLCTLLKQALAKANVEIVMLNAGVFRAMRDYEAGPFTMGHLFEEFATMNLQRVVPMPGSVIAAAILTTRSRAKPAPGFLHVDADTVVTAEHVVTTIDGQAFDCNRMYTVCLNFNLLVGLDNIEPLKLYQDEHLERADPESCSMARNIILKFLMQSRPMGQPCAT